MNGLLCLLGEPNGPCQADDLTWHALEVNVLHAAGKQSLQTRIFASGKLACSAGETKVVGTAVQYISQYSSVCLWAIGTCARLYIWQLTIESGPAAQQCLA